MRKISWKLAPFLVWSFAIPCRGQQSPASPKDFQNADVTRTTTYILPTGSKEFDEALRKAVEENWSLSPIGPIEDLKGDLDRSDPKRTYIGYVTDPTFNLTSITLIRGGVKGSFDAMGYSEFLSRSWTEGYHVGVNDHRLPLLIETLEQSVRIRSSPEKKFDRTDETDINLLTQRLRGKKPLFEPNAGTYDADVELVKENYHLQIAIVDRDGAIEAIAARRSDEALLVFCSVYPWVFVYDLATRECIFWGRKKTYEKSVELLNDLVDG